MWKWIVGVPVGLFAAVMIIGSAANTPEREAQRLKEAKAECARAVMSNLDTSTHGYADRKAYNDHVREKCRDFNIPKLNP